ncbi:hypothetical protein D3C72_1885850 [compost metagenome]
MALEKHWPSIDQSSPALVHLHGTGQHRAVVVTGTLQHGVLIRQVTIVDADDALVALERVDIGNHITGCHGDMPNMRH